MKSISAKIFLPLMLVAVVLLVTACQQFDVVANGSIQSFDEMLAVNASNTTWMEEKEVWAYTAPDGTAQFLWTSDTKNTNGYDVAIRIDAQPFINAGLDSDALEDIVVEDGLLILSANLSDSSSEYKNTDINPVSSYAQVVYNAPEAISHHTALDHFSIAVGHGNNFEWAKDMASNDKDVVFALSPDQFIEAGVDPYAVEGWVYTTVPVMDMSGKEVEVYRFIKAFDLL